MTTVELKTAPELRRLLNKINYTKRVCFVSQFPNSGLNVNSYWDGGSKDEYTLINLNTLNTSTLVTSHPYFDVAGRGLANKKNEICETDAVGNLTLKVLPEGVAIIRHGYFCGKKATAHLYFHPNNLTKFLPAG